jgi:hypothetical protein
MRSEFPPLDHWTSIKLQPLELENSLDIWRAIDAAGSGIPALPDLLEAIGYLLYAIVLIATQALRSAVSPSDILTEWRKPGHQVCPKW